MTIREYFDSLELDLDELMDYEATLYACSQDDPEDFESWALENGIDLTARDEDMNEYVLTLWQWDMCGD